ncbi:MAG: tetraacyldisaccharide 4'-kinase [Planctomycetes bacterium]|nr:tetraacyldisaccharide 4'-kinase [Planctomycetota bacterium]
MAAPAAELLRVVRRSLWPASLVYAGVTALRNATFDWQLRPVHGVDVRVVSVGNLTVGGTGKTPLVVELVRRARALGLRPGVLARGYGRAPGAELNDEGLLLRDRFPDLPQVQDPDRVAGARRLAASGAVDLILLDDGFQHRRLRRDVDVVCLDASDPFDGFRLLPTGDLRELAGPALRRADHVVLTRAGALDTAALQQRAARVRQLAQRDDLPVDACDHVAEDLCWLPAGEVAPAASLRGRRVHLLSAIARPAAFERTVAELGADVVRHTVRRDHHRHDPTAVAALARDAARDGAALLTTEKDAVKLRGLAEPLAVLRIGLRFLAPAPRPDAFGLGPVPATPR